MNLKTRIGGILLIPIFLISCRTFRTNLQVESIKVSFLGGNTYKVNRNNGNKKLAIRPKEASETSPQINNNLDVYSSGETPVTINIGRNNNLVTLSNAQGKEFVLGELNTLDYTCHYDCNLLFSSTDRISFESKLSVFIHWNGIHILSNTPLFTRYHYYILKITKNDGKVLTAKWQYNIYKIRSSSGNTWSGDQVTRNSGLIRLKIKS